MATVAQSNVAAGADEHRWKMCVSGCTVDETKLIVSLPCFHSICSMRCLNNLKRLCSTVVSTDDKVFICNICKIRFKPEDLEHRVVPKDVFLKKPEEAVASVVTCDACTSGHPAVAYCSDCPNRLCKGCKLRHSNKKATRLHQVEEGVQKWGRKNEHGKCKVHPLQNSSHYCSTCSEKVCEKCVEQHEGQGHSIFNMQEAFGKVAAAVEAARQFRGKCVTVRDKMEKKKWELKADWFTVMKNLNEAFADTIKTIRGREALLKVEARNKFMTQTLDIQTKKQNLKHLKELATRNYNVSREIINNKDESAAALFLRHYEHVLNKTSTLGQSIERNYDNFVEKDLHLGFTTEENNTTEDIIKAVSTYAHIEDSYTGRKADPAGPKKTYSRAKKSATATATTSSSSVVQPSTENMLSEAAAPVSPGDEEHPANQADAESVAEKDVPPKPEEQEDLGCDTPSDTSTEPAESSIPDQTLQLPQQRTLEDNEAAGSSSRITPNFADNADADATLDTSVSLQETANTSQGGLGRRERRKKVFPNYLVADNVKKTERKSHSPLDQTKTKRGRPVSLTKNCVFDSFQEAPADSTEEPPELCEYPVQGKGQMKVTSDECDDTSEDYCFICLDGGEVICCDKCPKAFHVACHAPIPTDAEISGYWQCYHCTSLVSLKKEAAAAPPDEGAENRALVPDNKRHFPIACKFVIELYKIPEVATIRWVFPRDFPNTGIAGKKVPFHLKYIRERLTNGKPEPFRGVDEFLKAFWQMFIQAFLYYKKHEAAKQHLGHARTCFQKFLKVVDKHYPEYRSLFDDVHKLTD